MIPPRLVAKHSADCSSAPFAMFPFGRERENINASTGLPYFDDSVVGCKITGFTSNDGSHDIIKLVDSRDDIKHEIWAGETNADGAGFFNLKSVTAATIVGQSIKSVGLALFRASGELFIQPHLDPAPAHLFRGPSAAKSGERMGVAFVLSGGGTVFPTRDRAGQEPIGCMLMCEDGEDVTDVDWPAHTFKSVGALADERDIKRRQDAADLAARKCACGNFKTPGHVDGLCNACRSKAAPSPSTSAASKRKCAEPENPFDNVNVCPHCSKDLSALGPLRTERHITRCDQA